MKYLTNITLSILMALSLAACESDGPVENLGENVDDAYNDSKDAVNDAADSVSDGVEDACEEVSNENC